jgi:hypothetical protein
MPTNQHAPAARASAGKVGPQLPRENWNERRQRSVSGRRPLVVVLTLASTKLSFGAATRAAPNGGYAPYSFRRTSTKRYALRRRPILSRSDWRYRPSADLRGRAKRTMCFGRSRSVTGPSAPFERAGTERCHTSRTRSSHRPWASTACGTPGTRRTTGRHRWASSRSPDGCSAGR